MKIVTVVGARPQFIKAAVVSRAIAEWNERAGVPAVREIIVHTGQHFDANMSDVFFEELRIPKPDHHLGIGGMSHGAMTGRMLEAIEEVLLEQRPAPDWMLVYGDTNSTIAGALAAVKLHIKVAHVEAGLRSFNRAMPEEINRVLTDHAADLLFAPTEVAVQNLRAEGLPEDRIIRTGDVMFDATMFHVEHSQRHSTILARIDVREKNFALATVHRAENTDNPARLIAILDGLIGLAQHFPVVLPLHPRTRAALENQNLLARANEHLRIIDPIGYLDMVRLEFAAALIATDSGGVQKEAYFARVPCLTLRDETEWIETVEHGANTLVGADARRIIDAGRRTFGTTTSDAPLYGDGKAGAAIVEHLIQRAPGTTTPSPKPPQLARR